MFWLTVLFYLLLVGVTALARRRSKTWFSPAAFFGGVWCILGGLPLAFSAIPVPPAGELFIAASVAALLAGEWAADRWLPGPREQKHSLPTRWPLIEWLLVACVFIGLMTVLIDVGSLGRGPTALIYLTRSAYFLYWANQGGNWQEPGTARVLVTATYVGPLLAGLLLGVRSAGWKRWAALAVLVPGLFLTLILTTKSSFVLPLLLGVSAFLAARVATGRPPEITLRRAGAVAAVAVVLGAAAVASQMVRYEGQPRGQFMNVVTLLWSDLFPYLAVFSSWLQNGGWATTHPAFGYYSFAGLFDLLRIHVRPAGLYSEQAVVNGATYNIYTAFRGLIEDFTLPGALVVLGLAGFGARFAHVRARAGDVRYIAPLAAFFVFTLWSWVVDIFIYNTILLAFALFGLYLWFATRPAFARRTERVDRVWAGADRRLAPVFALVALLLAGSTVLAATGLNPGCQGGSVTSDLPSPQPVGTSINFTATSMNCSSPRYEWWIRAQPRGSWTRVQAYSDGSNRLVLDTSKMAPGIYTIDAWVEQVSSPVGLTGYETFGILTYTLTPPSG